MAWRHTAIIYVHGVGSPQRHVSLSNFLDFFDLYGQTQSKDEVGKPRKFQTNAELLDDSVIHNVEFKKVNIIGGRPVTTKTVKVYEAYWVPESLTKFSIFYLLTWLLIRIKTPIIVMSARWRNFSALRIAALHRLASTYDHPGRLEKLERFYRDFDNWEGRSRYKKGSFSEYVEHLKSSSMDQDRPGLLEAAKLWKSEFQTSALRSFFMTASLGIFLIWVGFLAYHALGSVYYEIKKDRFQFDLPIMIDGFFLVLLVTGIFLTVTSFGKYVFDVIAWTIESERDQRFAARKRVVDFTQKLLRHVVDDENCGECYVVAHSLGTCIAMEALLREGERAKIQPKGSPERSNPTLAKVRAIFTIGSPIDLIFSFFQSDRTFSHRYNRLYEDKRHSIGLPPFWIDGRSGQTRIYNYWSRFDPISSVVLSMRKKLSERKDAINNIECLPPGAPRPIKSHISYFADPSVMGAIYRAVMLGQLPPVRKSASIPDFQGFGRKTNYLATILVAICISTILVFHILFWPIAICAGISVGWFFWRKRVLASYQTAVGPYLKR